MATPAIGRSYMKIDARRRDLERVMQILPKNPRILEFGSGYSTIFFSFSSASTIVSVEEHENYVPKIVGAKNYTGIVSETEMVEVDSWVTKKHLNIEFLNCENFDFIYIDGPQTPKSKNNEVAPNVDLAFLTNINLAETVIGVDIRINTVTFLENFLAHSHYPIYSRKVFLKKQIFADKDPSSANKLHQNEFGLKLTTLFIPNSRRIGRSIN